jgi:hypothetical protein
MATFPEPVTTTNIKIAQGTTFSFLLTMENPAGSAWNVTGATFAGKIKQTFVSTSSLVDFTFTNTNLAIGEVTVSLTSSQTAALDGTINWKGEDVDDTQREVVIGAYDIEMTLAGATYRVLQGTLTLSREATA